MMQNIRAEFDKFTERNREHNRQRDAAPPTRIKAGDLIMMRIPPSADEEGRRKLAKTFIPQLCVAVYDDNTYDLQDIFSAKVHSKVHVSRIKQARIDPVIYMATESPTLTLELCDTPPFSPDK